MMLPLVSQTSVHKSSHSVVEVTFCINRESLSLKQICSRLQPISHIVEFHHNLQACWVLQLSQQLDMHGGRILWTKLWPKLVHAFDLCFDLYNMLPRQRSIEILQALANVYL